MLKYLFVILLAIQVVLSQNTPCGNTAEDCSWEYDAATFTLKITGSGNMTDFHSLFGPQVPWSSYEDKATNVVIEGIEHIGTYAFDGFDRVATVSIPDTVTEIGEYAFNYCQTMSSINLPKNLKKIGSKAFYKCTSLSTVTLPESLQEIGDGAFSFSGITSINIPNGVENIGAFSFCDKLTEVVALSVKTIGEHAFRQCSNLKTVNIGDGVTSIGYAAFLDCTSLENVYFEGTQSPQCGNSAFTNTKITSVTVPNNYPDNETFCGISVNEIAMNKTCGEFTHQNGDGKQHITCSCVGNAKYRNDEKTECQCNETHYAVGDECREIIHCGNFTTEKGNTTNTKPCQCIDNAGFVGDSTTECQCDSTHYGVGDECREIITCGELTTEYQNTTNTEPCQCVDGAKFVGDSTTKCECKPTHLTVVDECLEIIHCGEFTTEKGNETNTEPCQCVTYATFKNTEQTECQCMEGAHVESEGSNTCVCDSTHHGVGDECKEIITCGEFTTEQGNTINTKPCQCVDGAKFVGDSTTKCECKPTHLTVDDECVEKITCGELTTEKGNTTNTEPCQCIDNAGFVENSSTDCKCNERYHRVDDECKEIITCGEFTTAYNNNKNTEACKCVDNARIEKEGSNKCKCDDGYEGNTEKTKCTKKTTGGSTGGGATDGSEMITMILVLFVLFLL